MQNNRYNSYIRLLLILVIMAFAGIGCTEGDRSECGPLLLNIRAIINVDGEYKEVGKDEVRELVLYVFNAKEEFIEAHNVEINSTVELFYPEHEVLNLVCWGNSANENQITPDIKVGDKLEDLLIILHANGTRVGQEIITTHPDDLFHARKKIVIAEIKSSVIEMVLRHKVASVNIITKGLTSLLTRASEDHTYTLRSGKKHANFGGSTGGVDVHHIQSAELKSDIHESGIFNILPSTDSDNHIEVDIYRGTDFIYTISKDDNGDPIVAKESELLNIYANFKGGEDDLGDVTISVATTPWGEKKIWKDI